MSTELLEPPAVETTKETPVAEPPKEQAKETPKKGTSLLDSLNVIVPERAAQELMSKESEPVKEEVKEPAKEEPKVDPPKEEPKPEVKPEVKDEPKMSEPARKQFAAMEKEAETWKTKAQDATRQLEEIKTKATEAETWQKRAEEAEKRAEQYARELKAASIERDPEFVRQYVDARANRLNEIKSLAKAAGATDEAFDRAIAFNDEDTLNEWRDSLKLSQRAAWDGHQSAIADLDYRKREAIKDSERTYQQLQQERSKQQQAQQGQLGEQHMQTARSVMEDLFTKNEAIREDDELRKMVGDTMEYVAGVKGEWGPKEIMQHVAAAVVQAKFLGIQAKALEGSRSELEAAKKERDELKTKLEEQEKRFKELSGGIPRSSGNGSESPKNEKPASLLSNVRIVLPG